MKLVSQEPMKFINRKIIFFFSFLLLFPFLLIFPKNALAVTLNLNGTVTTSVGNPVASAVVDIVNSSTLSNVGSTITDSNGNYSIQIDDGTYDVSVTPPSGSGFTAAIALNQNLTTDKVINFVLVPAGQVTFSGRVLDVSGNPVSNQIVALEGSGQSTTTNSTGNFSITVSSGTYQLNIAKSNNPTTLNVPQNYRVYKNGFSLTQSKMFDITLPLKQVVMHVQDGSSNSMANVGIMAAVHLVNHGAEANAGGLSIGGGITDASGYAEYGTFSSIAPKTDASGNVTLWLLSNNGSRRYNFKSSPPSGSGFLETQLNNILISTDTNLSTTLQQPVTFSGVLSDAQGNPVPNQLVALEGSGQSTSTNATGNYSLTVAPGAYTLVITKSNNPLSLNVPQNYRIFKSGYSINQNTVLNINLPLKQTVIHVQDAFSNPIENVSFRAGAHPTNQGIEINVGGLSIGGGITDASGYSEYGTLSGTPPKTDSSGNVMLWLLPNNGSKRYTLTGTPPTGSLYQSTSLTDIAIAADTSLTMTLQQPVTLSGHVYDSLGNPAPNQLVSLDGSGHSSTTNASGEYTLNVSAGTYTLNITKSNNPSSVNLPQNYRIFKNNYSISQNTVLEITIPVRQVIIHVQDQNNDTIQGVGIRAGAHLTNSGIEGNLGGLTIAQSINDASGYSEYGTFGSVTPTTNSLGKTTLWLIPNNGGRNYQFTATPPAGSVYNPFNLTSIPVIQNQTEIISLQFNHEAPVTIATLSPASNENNEYEDPTIVTLSATAYPGFTISNTYYTIDVGGQQEYTVPFEVTGEGEHTITFWSVDNVGVPESPNSLTFTIHENEAPTIDPINDASLNEGDIYSAGGSFTDPDSTSLTATVNYGDGSGDHPLALTGNTFNLNHSYPDNGTYTVTTEVTDDEGASDIEEILITVNNLDPVLDEISLSDNPIIVNSSTTASVSFTDAGVLDTHEATWDWGDGSSSNGTISEVNGSGTITDTHAYTDVGIYEITLTITDNDTGKDTIMYQYSSVYNPTSQGLFTGVRLFDSPIGAYYLSPTLFGQSRFGVNAKYTGTTPAGNVSLNFVAGNFEFESDTIHTLVIVNDKATLTGMGSANGVSGYTFTVTGIDVLGGGGLIRFQIKNGSTLIFDNQFNAPITDDPTTPVTGQIIVH